MRNIWTIASREYKHYFISPIAYIVAFITILTVGIFFLVNINYIANNVYYYGSYAPDAGIIIGPMATIFLFAFPALTMRLLADEQRMGTLELLLTAPLRDWELVVGKWLGAFLFSLTLIALTLVFPIVLNGMVNEGIDQGILIAGYVAIILVAAVYLAIGTSFSAMFANQFAAFFATLAALLFLWWLVRLPTYILPPGTINNVFEYLALNGRFSSMLSGVIGTSDIVYPISLTALGLFIGSIAIETRRWR